MQKLALVDILLQNKHLNAFRYLPLLKELGHERLVIYCDSGFASRHEGIFSELEADGVQIVIDDYAKAASHKYYLYFLDAGGPAPGSPADKFLSLIDSRGASLIYLPVRSIVQPGSLPTTKCVAKSFVLFPSDNDLFTFLGNGKYIVDEENYPIVGKNSQGFEAATGGLWNIPPQAMEMCARPKTELREELSEALKVSFKPEYPLVLYLPNHHNNREDTIKGLERLAAAGVNLLIHQIGKDPNDPYGCSYCDAKGPNIHWARRNDCQLELMKAAADVNMVEFFGTSGVTNIMMGLRSVTLYTQKFRAAVPHRDFSFTFMFRSIHLTQIQLTHFVPPLNAAGADLLLERINDQDYWKRYDEMLPKLQRKLLGNFWVGREGLKRITRLIDQILATGTLAPTPLNPTRIRSGQVQMFENLDKLDFVL